MSIDEGLCRAVVVTCIDYRFHPRMEEFLRSEELYGATDVIAWPGGGLVLATEGGGTVWGALAISIRLHNPAEAILVAHEDCGWLKERSANEDVDQLLRAAAEELSSRHPLEQVRRVVLTSDGVARTVAP